MGLVKCAEEGQIQLLGAWEGRFAGPLGQEHGLFRPRPALPCARTNTAPGKQRWLRDGAVRRRVRRRWPQAEVAEDLLDDLALVNERDDAHRPFTAWTHQRISLIDFLNQFGPALLEDR